MRISIVGEIFGFLINAPLTLYSMQGLNLTPHRLVWRVGMRGIGLVLFGLRGMKPDLQWNESVARAHDPLGLSATARLF